MKAYKLPKRSRVENRVFNRCCRWSPPYGGRHRKARIQRFRAKHPRAR